MVSSTRLEASAYDIFSRSGWLGVWCFLVFFGAQDFHLDSIPHRCTEINWACRALTIRAFVQASLSYCSRLATCVCHLCEDNWSQEDLQMVMSI